MFKKIDYKGANARLDRVNAHLLSFQFVLELLFFPPGQRQAASVSCWHSWLHIPPCWCSVPPSPPCPWSTPATHTLPLPPLCSSTGCARCWVPGWGPSPSPWTGTDHGRCGPSLAAWGRWLVMWWGMWSELAGCGLTWPVLTVGVARGSLCKVKSEWILRFILTKYF